MKRFAALILAIGLTAAACGEPTGDVPTGPGDPTTTTTSPPTPSADIMAVALAQVAGVDHTFGSGPPPFDVYLVQTQTDPHAGGEFQQTTTRALTDEERTAVEALLSPLGDVRWIDDPAEYQSEDLTPVIERSVILGVGEPSIDGDTALAPVSLWCGGLCGTWLTYRVDLTDGAWSVTDIEGPVIMS
jgi:hypothetical protein